MIHEIIDLQVKTRIPYFEKAQVHIRFTAPFVTRSHRLWDTLNRANNVIINNLDDDNFEHMSCSIEAKRGEIV